MKIHRFLFAALIGALTVQVFLLIRDYGPRTVEVYKAIGQTGLWRGANFAFGQQAADFYTFLNAEIPRDSEVLIPAEGPQAFTKANNASFFLWPRRVSYCEGGPQTCIQEFGGQNYAILVSEAQAVPNPKGLGDRFRAFNDEWAVYLPAQGGPATPQLPYSSLLEVLGAALAPLLLLVALALPGSLLAKTTLPGKQAVSHLALGVGAGLGWFSLTLFISLWLDVALTSLLIFLLVLLYWFAASLAWLLLKNRGTATDRKTEPAWGEAWPLALLSIPVVWAVILAVGSAYSHTDEIVLWGAKGYGILADGLQSGVTYRGTLTTWYPLNIPLLIGSFLKLFAERLPESKLIFPVYYLGFLGLVFSFLRRNTPVWVSLVGSLLIATTPAIFLMGTMAHANLPFTFYLVGGVLLLHISQQEASFSLAFWIWGVAFLILAAWTRPEGLLLAWLVSITALLIFRANLLKAKTKIFWLVGGLGAYTVFWYFAAPFAYLQPGFSAGVLPSAVRQILGGNLHFSDAAYVLTSFFEKLLTLSEWGTLGWVLLALTLLSLWLKTWNPQDLQLALFGVVVLAAVLGAYVAYSYAAVEQFDLSGWVNTGLMRLALPGFLLMWLAVFNNLFSSKALIPRRE